MGNIKIGDWVTQYRTGYWMVKELHPKFSPFEVGLVHKGTGRDTMRSCRKHSVRPSSSVSRSTLVMCRYVLRYPKSNWPGLKRISRSIRKIS